MTRVILYIISEFTLNLGAAARGLLVGEKGKASTGASLCQYSNVREKKRSKETFHSTISFIVPVFNRESEVAECVGKLFSYASQYEGFVEIFVVDNGSRDQTYEVAYAAIELNRKRFPRVRAKIIRLTTRLEVSEIIELCSKTALGQRIAIVECEKEKVRAKALTAR